MSEIEVVEEQKNSAGEEKRAPAENVAMQSMEEPIEKAETLRVGAKKSEGNKKNNSSRSISIFSCVRTKAKKDYTDRLLVRIAILEAEKDNMEEQRGKAKSELGTLRDELERAKTGWVEEKREKAAITAELSTAEDKIRAREEAKQAAEQKAEGLEKEVHSRGAQLLAATRKLEVSGKDKKRLEKKVATVKAERDTARREKKKALKQVATANSRAIRAETARDEAEKATKEESETMKNLFDDAPLSSIKAVESIRSHELYGKLSTDLHWFIDHCIQLPDRSWVFFDITVDGNAKGRIVMELYNDIMPKTAENFRALCTGEKGIGTNGKPLHYKGCPIHKVYGPNRFISGGDIINGDGTGGESIYGGKFDDEKKMTSTRGDLLMYSNGRNHSKFYITAGPRLLVCVFGRVVEGMEVVDAVAALEHDDNLKPTSPVVIADCGQL